MRRDLDQEPGDDTVSRGRAIDIAPFELIEKVARIHGELLVRSGQHRDHQPDAPARNFKNWKRLRRDLDEKPRHDGVSDCYLVDVPPPEFGEKVSRIHSLLPELVSRF